MQKQLFFSKKGISELEELVHQHPDFSKANISEIQIHPQMRKTFREISDLADNIFVLSLLNPIILNVKEGSETTDLVAGERRYRAHRYLLENFDKYLSGIIANIPKRMIRSKRAYEETVKHLKREHERKNTEKFQRRKTLLCPC